MFKFMKYRGSFLSVFAVLFLFTFDYSLPADSFAIPAGCTSTGNGYSCQTQGEASLACEEVRADYATTIPGSWVAQCNQLTGSIRCGGYVNGSYQSGCNTVAFPNKFNFTYSATCSALPPTVFGGSGFLPSINCDGGCEYDLTTGMEFFGSLSGWAGNFSPNGSTCDGSGNVGGNAANDCNIQNGVLTCDCTADPGASFCQNDPNCTADVNGNVTCDPANPPYQPGGGDNGPGGPGDGSGNPDGTPPGGGNPGDSCSAGQANCFNGTGGDCLAGETCSFGSGGMGDGPPQTCDPLVENCDGQGTAGTSGDCSVQPPCSGDAIQCAILVQSWKNTCYVMNTQGEKAPWQGDSDYGRDLADEATDVDISGGLDDAGFAAGSCPASFSLNIMGAEIVIDFAPLCSVASIVRIFVIMFTLLWAGPYVIRSF